MACMVLHNFIILEGEAYEVGTLVSSSFPLKASFTTTMIFLLPDDVINEVPEDGHHDERLAEAQANGVLKRDYIAAMLMNPVAEENEEAEDDPGY